MSMSGYVKLRYSRVLCGFYSSVDCFMVQLIVNTNLGITVSQWFGLLWWKYARLFSQSTICKCR